LFAAGGNYEILHFSFLWADKDTTYGGHKYEAFNVTTLFGGKKPPQKLSSAYEHKTPDSLGNQF
jgi:hypothetical protein